MLTCRPSAAFMPTFADFPELHRLMGAMVAPAQPGSLFPPVNVWEDERALHVESELPGYTLENIDITMLGDELTIAGSRREPPVENAVHLRRERAAATAEFRRSLRIGIPIDADKIQATLRQGVLSIIVPKVEAAKPRKIEVKPA
jgi:HSP20 family protein